MANVIDNSNPVEIFVTGPEHFLTYTEADPEGNIIITDDKVAWTNANRTARAGVYKDYGIGYFGDFSHTMKTLLSYQSNKYSAILGVWAVSNGQYTLQEIIQAGGISLFWWTDPSDNIVLRLSQYGPILADYSVPLSLNVEYSLTLTRIGTTVTCNIVGGAVNDTLTLTGVDPRTYSMIVAYHSYYNQTNSSTSTGYDKDLMF